MIAVVFVGARYVVPLILSQVLRTRSREVFLLSVLAICLGVVWLTSRFGVSLALGAFLAGLIVSESESSHDALGHITPFRDVFTSFFFVSVGMLLDFHVLLQKPLVDCGSDNRCPRCQEHHRGRSDVDPWIPVSHGDSGRYSH